MSTIALCTNGLVKLSLGLLMSLQKCRYSNHYLQTLFSLYPNESGLYLVALTLAAVPIKGERKDISLFPSLTHTQSLSFSLLYILSHSLKHTHALTISLSFRSLPEKSCLRFALHAEERLTLTVHRFRKQKTFSLLGKKISQLSLFKVHTTHT